MTTEERETLVARNPIHVGRLLAFFDDEVVLSDGTRAHREVVEHRGAVALIAVDAERRVVLVRQWRHAVGRSLWELPAGTCEHGEPTEVTAGRELTEEAGVVAGSLEHLGDLPLSPGYSTEVMHFYLATDLSAGEAAGDADERIAVGRFSAGEVVALLAAGELDVKTVAGLSLAGWSMRARV